MQDSDPATWREGIPDGLGARVDSRTSSQQSPTWAEHWRAIFKRQLDPFAATTQKKLKLKGDFAKISRWYVPFNRLFDLWTAAPVE